MVSPPPNDVPNPIPLSDVKILGAARIFVLNGRNLPFFGQVSG